MRQNSKEEERQFQSMCNIEPRLAKLRAKAVLLLKEENVFEVEEDDDSPDEYSSIFWNNYEVIKRELKQYVGWFCPGDFPEFMATEQAFDTSYREIFSGLL